MKKLIRKVGLDFDQPSWQRVLREGRALWQDARLRAESGPAVLIATSHGGHKPSTVVESLLAVALTLRGANVHVLLCDEALPACTLCDYIHLPDTARFVEEGPKALQCWNCYPVGERIYRSLGLPIQRYSKLVTPDEQALAARLASSLPIGDIPDYCADGVAVGEHAQAGALRYFARGTLNDEPHGEAVLRRYFQASLLTTFAARRLFTETPFVSACFNHGIYVPQGLIGEVARQCGARVVNWNPGYRKKRFIFSHHDTYHHTLLSEPTGAWENMAWTEKTEQDTLDYLRSRWSGSQDWIQFLDKNAQEDTAAIARELGMDFSRPTIALLTNVMWDAQLHYRANAFPNMLSWVLQTLEYFRKRPELNLVARVHPAERTGHLPSQQPIVAEIRRHLPELSPNIFLIPPESKISTYALTQQCNAAIIYGTKTGVELTSQGIPVVVAGEAWIRNKGLTLDARTPEEYFRLLDDLPLPSRLDEETVRRARMYAFHFFFRRMIPIEYIEPAERFGPYKLNVSRLDDLLPGRDAGLDVICEGILRGADFIYPAEALP